MKSSLFPSCYDNICIAQEGNDAIYVAPHRQWMSLSIINSIHDACFLVQQMDPPLLSGDDKQLQMKIYKHWMAISPPMAPLTMSDRLAKTFGFVVVEPQLQELCDLLVRTMKGIPNFIQVAFFRSVRDA